MKKTVAWFIVLLLLLSLTACSAPQSPMITHDADASEATEVPAAEPEPTAEPEKRFSHGTWNGRTFTSDYAGLTLTLPDDDWTIASDEELAEIMDIDDANLLEQAMIRLTNITDMQVQNANTGASIILMFENLALNPAAKDITVEEYAGILADGLMEYEDYTYTVDETTTVTLCGKEYLALPTHVAEYDLDQTYLMRYEGDMMVDLILTGMGDGSIDELLAMFAD